MKRLKHWAVFDDSRQIVEIIKSDRRPLNGVLVPKDPISGEYEDREWLQIEMTDKEFIATVDQSLKTSVLADREVITLDNQAKAEQKKGQKDLLVAKGLSFDKSTINNIDDIRNALEDIVNALLILSHKK